MSLDWLPGLDPSTGTFTLPLWAAGVAAALFVALIVIAVIRAGVTEFGSMIFRVAIVVIAVVFGWTYVTRTADRDRADERRSLDSRAVELVGRAVVPGSAIACLEATNTETVEGSLRARRVREPGNRRGGDPPISRRGFRCSPTRMNSPRGATRATSRRSPACAARLRPTATGLPRRCSRSATAARRMPATRSASSTTTRSCART